MPEGDAPWSRGCAPPARCCSARLTLGALAYGDIWFGGKTRNPWNLNEGSSGSSAGSASATAAGLCGFAIGTETYGSITSPSQRCGTTGLRPTFGRVSRAGAMALCWSLDKIGPICRSVEDCALVLAAINGGDPADRSSIDAPFNFDARAGIAGMRLGWLPAAFEDEARYRRRPRGARAARRLGIELVELRLPDLPYASLMGVLYAEAAAAFEELTLSDRDDELGWQEEGAWPNAFRKARFLSAVDHVQLDRLRYRVMEAVGGLFDRVDALIGPFMTGPMLVASNFTGHPCLHLRAGFLAGGDASDPSLAHGKLIIGEAAGDSAQFEVPQGISLWAGLFDEGRLCNLGMALEAELGVADRRPTFREVAADLSGRRRRAQVAGDLMAGPEPAQRRHLDPADLLGDRAARVKGAAGRRIAPGSARRRAGSPARVSRPGARPEWRRAAPRCRDAAAPRTASACPRARRSCRDTSPRSGARCARPPRGRAR